MAYLTITSYNTHKCVGTDHLFSPDRIIKVIKECNTDIIALQEVDKRFGSRRALINTYELYRETGLHYAEMQTTKPSSIGWHGNAIFYRNVNLISIEPINLPGLEPRGALFAIFRKDGISFCVIAAHFGLLRRCRKSQVKIILHILSKKYSMPAFLLGDLNEWRKNKSSGLYELTQHFYLTDQLKASFPARFPVLSLDKIYASNKEMITNTQVHDTPLARKASDHLPVKAMINLTN